MRLVWVAALVASTGCAQLFGIDDTTGAGPNTNSASVQVQHVSVGASVIKSPQDMTDQTVTFYDDSTLTLAPVPGVQTAMDTFTGEANGTPPAIFTIPDPTVPQRMWATPALAQKGNYIRYEHPSPQEPLPSSTVTVNVALPTAYVTGENFTVQAIGAWMQHPLTDAELPAPDTAVTTIAAPMIAYAGFTPMIGGYDKTRITNSDVVLLLRYAAAKLTGVFQAQFDQIDGENTMSGTMTAVTANTPVTATIDPGGYATRFATVRPAVAATPSMAWRVNAAPGHSVGAEFGVRLVNGASAVTDTMVDTTFGNPFESLDWKAIFVFSTSAARAYTYTENAMSANISLSSAMATFSEPSASLNINMPAGLPITIQANQSTLVTDGMMLPLDLSAPVVIHATVDKATNTAYQLTLVELGLDITGTAPIVTRTVVVDAITTGGPDFRLPPALFTVGKSYYITIRCYQGGLVNAETGDLQTLTFPYSTGSLDSAVFTVGMP